MHVGVILLELELVELHMVEAMYIPGQEENRGQNLVEMCHRFACWLNAFVSLLEVYSQILTYSISSCIKLSNST